MDFTRELDLTINWLAAIGWNYEVTADGAYHFTQDNRDVKVIVTAAKWDIFHFADHQYAPFETPASGPRKNCQLVSSPARRLAANEMHPINASANGVLFDIDSSSVAFGALGK